ncbi:MAG: hypothetical protein ACI9H6_000109 [Patiriisocius sp.]|jgi:hypothetical protein
MGIDVFTGAGPCGPQAYIPTTIIAVGLSVPINFNGDSLLIQQIVRENLAKKTLVDTIGVDAPTAYGVVWGDDRADEAYGYNVWYFAGAGIGGGWNRGSTFEEDVETFKRFPSCLLIIEKDFYSRLEKMAEAAGSKIQMLEFEHPDLLGLR